MAQLGFENGTICRNLSLEESLEYTYTNVDVILILICIPVICISGILLNSSFLFVLYRVRDMRTTTNVYLGNLAVADSLLLLVRLVRYVGTYFYFPVDILTLTAFKNSFMNGLPMLLLFFFHIVSVFFISFVAFERYTSICRPITHRKMSSRYRTFRFTLVGWILPLVFVVCHAGSFDIQNGCVILPSSNFSTNFSVYSLRKWADISITMGTQCQFWMAFIGNCIMYIAIVHKLSENNRETHLKKSIRERNHVAKMLIINACVFFTFLMPMQIYDMVYIIDIASNLDLLLLLSSYFGWIAAVTSVINSAVNPMIYGATNPNFRKAFRKTFFSSCLTTRTDSPTIEMRREDV